MKMKYRKERDFVKRICEELHFEVIVSRIKILESGEEWGAITDVLFEDRFSEQYKVFYNKKGEPQIRHLRKEGE